MSPERWRQIREAFEEATRLQGASRAALLGRYEADPELHREVTSLLEAEAQAEGFLEGNAADEPPRKQVGPWVITRELGRGGMGTVYEATRTGEFTQRVALKVVRRGMDTDFILERFRAERQILAALDHPNIATLLDGGTTDDGLPYFVMGFVDGQPIDAYCAAHRLDTAARVQLFLKVCDAVDYAHRSLVVHRDLKPANILVDQQGTPKLLDFGIARLTSREGRAQATTAAELRLLTPAYASPEQVKGTRVTTASDVFSLGVLLFELLTGRRPWRPDDESTDALMRAVAEQQAEPPSAYAPGIGRDLDTIVLQCLRKEPERRYASVERLADDLRRCLDRRPVAARKETLGYVVSSFVRRNTLAVGAAGAVAVSLVGGIVTTTWQARVARAEAARAQAARASAEGLIDFMLGDLRKKLQPSSRLEVMGDIAHQAQAYFDGLDPGERTAATDARRASVYAQLAELKVLQGNAPDAEALLASSMALYAALDGGVEARLAEGYNLKGRIAEEKGELDTAAAEFQRSRVQWERATARDASPGDLAYLAGVWNDEGRVAYAQGRRDDAQANHGKALAILEQLPQASRSTRDVGLQRSSTLLYLGRIAEEKGDYAQATTVYAQARDAADALLVTLPGDAELKHHTAVLCEDLSRVQRLAGQLEASERDGQRALTMLQALVAKDPDNGLWKSDLSAGYSFLGRTHELQGKLAQALTEFQGDADVMTGLSAQEPENGIYKAGLADALANVGRARRGLKQLREAREATLAGLKLREALLVATPDDAWAQADVGDSLLELGRTLRDANDPAGAKAAWERGAAVLEQVVKSSQLTRHRGRYAQVLLELGQVEKARTWVTQLQAEHYTDPAFVALVKARGL